MSIQAGSVMLASDYYNNVAKDIQKTYDLIEPGLGIAIRFRVGNNLEPGALMTVGFNLYGRPDVVYSGVPLAGLNDKINEFSVYISRYNGTDTFQPMEYYIEALTKIFKDLEATEYSKAVAINTDQYLMGIGTVVRDYYESLELPLSGTRYIQIIQASEPNVFQTKTDKEQYILSTQPFGHKEDVQ